VDEDDTSDNLLRITYDEVNNTSVKDFVPQSVFDQLLSSQETETGDQPSGKKKVVKKKKKYHTFLVFSTGSIIMSSKGKNMEKIFNDIVNILLQNRDHFEKVKVQRKFGKDLISEKYPQLVNNYYKDVIQQRQDDTDSMIDFISYKDWHIDTYPEKDIEYTSEKFKQYKHWFGFTPEEDLDVLRHEIYLNQMQSSEEELESEISVSDFSETD
jgi:hypothetical protein